uniref:TRANSPARENT TESTA 12 protein n=1 Tax=Solanum tuberosum TaxID=4113 RepID=M1CMH6_SOLTU
MDTQDIECPLIRETVKEEESKNKKNEILEEMKRLLILAGPLMTVNFLIYCLQVISIMFVGHLGELALSGASMATSFASVTGLSLMGIFSYYLDKIRKYQLKQEVMRYMIPTIFAFALLQCHNRFLQARNNVIPMMFSAGITTLLHIFTCWILGFKSGLGNKGAALANVISYWINLLLLAGYVRISPSCKNTWTGFSKEAFHDIWKYMRLAIPSAVMLCLEIWSFEMMVLLSGLLPNPKLETSVLSISLNTCAMVYMIPLGLSGATSVRVSNELGAGRPQAARLAATTAVLLVATEGVVAAIVLISVRKLWGYCYSTEEEVVGYVAEMLVLLAGSTS